MKVILNEDVRHLGEIGDIKNVAAGYYRNYLFPRKLAVACTPAAEARFNARKAEIEAYKEQKRKDSLSLKEKLEALEVVLSMPAGKTGKLYGAVTSQTLADFYAKSGFEIEKKRIEIPSRAIKSVGNYTAKIRLYENSSAEVKLVVRAQGDAGEKTANQQTPAGEAVPPVAQSETATEG